MRLEIGDPKRGWGIKVVLAFLLILGDLGDGKCDYY
jgi:hypothetical protein